MRTPDVDAYIVRRARRDKWLKEKGIPVDSLDRVPLVVADYVETLEKEIEELKGLLSKQEYDS